MTNTYSSKHGDDDLCTKKKKKKKSGTSELYEPRGWATLPKDLGSCHNNNNYMKNDERTKQPRYRSSGFKEALKNKFTIFGTLLHSKKTRNEPEDFDASDGVTEQLLTNFVTQHTEPVNYDQLGNLVSGRMDNLIHLMTPSNVYYPDQKYIFTFLLCCRLFMPPARLLKKLINNVNNVIEEDKDNESEILKKFVQLLTDWSNMFPYDFKEKLMMSHFNKFSTMVKTASSDLSPPLNYIAIHLVQKFKELLAYVENVSEAPARSDEASCRRMFDVCLDPNVVAEQLTLIEIDKMCKLSAEQFVEKFIAEDITCSRLDLTELDNHATTLELYVSWFNRLSYLVATEICTCAKKRDRVKLINFFINVAANCLKIGNFNSFMAIITGLNVNAVGRMSKTWQKANTAKLKKLEFEVDPKGNFARYRDMLRLRMNTSSNDIVVPIFSILVKDIYFLNEGIKDKLPNGLVNYHKFTQLSQQLNDFLSKRNKRCYYLRKQNVIEYFLETPVFDENGIYKSSFEVEKPDNNFERDRFKSVRMKMGHAV